MKINFLTFQTSNWTRSKERFIKYQSIYKKYGFFDTFNIRSENDLDQYFYNRFGNYTHHTCFCYFAWKPYILMKTLNEMENGDALIYLDGGCTLPETDDKIKTLLEQISDKIQNLNSFNMKIGVGENNYYTPFGNVEIQIKRQILQLFGLYEDMEFRKKFPHYEAGMIFIINDENTRKFITNWYKVYEMYYESVITYPTPDRFSRLEQDDCYNLNNSDQSILQCMLYKINGQFMSLKHFFYDTGICTRDRG